MPPDLPRTLQVTGPNPNFERHKGRGDATELERAQAVDDLLQHWELAAARLLHDGSLQVTDRAAGCLVLLFGQNMTRIAALTTGDVTGHGQDVSIRLGQHEAPSPNRSAACSSPWPGKGNPTSASAHIPAAAGCFPGCPPAARSPQPGSQNDSGTRNPRPSRAPRRPARPRSPAPRRRARRPPRPAPHHRRGMDAPDRRRLDPVRRTARPQPQSPTMRNNPSPPAPAQVFGTAGTFLSTGSETSGHNRAELERRLGHANGRYLRLYTNPPGDIAASYVEDL